MEASRQLYGVEFHLLEKNWDWVHPIQVRVVYMLNAAR